MIQLQLGQSRGDRRLEPALVCAALDLEKAVLTKPLKIVILAAFYQYALNANELGFLMVHC